MRDLRCMCGDSECPSCGRAQGTYTPKMDAQTTILRACQHDGGPMCEVNMGHGEVINVCPECWNRSVDARKTERKTKLAEHWAKYRAEQAIAMESAGAGIGQRVYYFCASMLGAYFGGINVTGTIVLNRNKVAVVKLDSPHDGKRYTQWNKAWKQVRDNSAGEEN